MRHEFVTQNRNQLFDRTFVGWAIRWVITALDTSSGSARLDELNVVLVSKALAALRVPVTACSAGGIVLSSSVVGIQTREMGGVNAASH